MIWMYRSGKPEDPFIPITQTLRIKDGVVLLEEIPDNFQRPTVTHDTITFSEIQSGDPGATNYRIIYKYGIIVFNHVNNGELVTINYFGTGRFFLPANRVYAQIDDENNVTQSLKDLLDDNEAAIEAITTLADLVSQINEFQHMGTYDPAIIYKVRNVVDDNSGNSFMAVQESVGQSLSDTTHWRPIALKGDMHKSVYDQGDIGVVDDSQKLGGQLPSYYEPAFEKNTAFNKDFGTTEGTVCDGGAVGSISSLETSDKTNVVSAINEVNQEVTDLDKEVAGRLVKSVAGNLDITLTDAEALNKQIIFTGELTGNINVVFPTTTRIWHVQNLTTGEYTLGCKTASGEGIILKQANPPDFPRVKQITSDGTDIIWADEGNVLETHKAETATDDVHGLAGKVIEESGTNDNGSYVRFADGTQICWRSVAPNRSIKNTEQTFSFSKEFLEVPAASASHSFGINVEYQLSCGTMMLGVTTTNWRVGFPNTTSVGATNVMHLLAIGKWK